MPAIFQRLFLLYRNAFAGLPRKVWLISFIMLVNRSGAMVVAFLSIYLINERGFSLTEAGYVMMAFGLGGIFGNYVGGLLNDRYGSWHIQLYSLIGAGLLNILLGQLSEYWMICGLAFCISLVADAFRPANRAAIATYAPPERLTQCYGLQRMAVNLGLAIGPAVGGYLIYARGFEFIFWADGLTFLVAAGLFALLLPADETAKPLIEKATPKVPKTLDAQLVRSDSEGIPSVPAHRQPWLLVFCLANACIMLCFFALFSTYPAYLGEMGFDERYVGWFYTLNGLIIVAVEMPAIYEVERRFRPLPVILLGGALIALGYFMLPLGEGALGLYALVAMMVLISVGEILYMPLTNAYVSRHAPLARRGEYLGLLSASYSAGFVLTPLLGFRLAESFDFATATLVSAAIAVVGVALHGLIPRLRDEAGLRSVRPRPS